MWELAMLPFKAFIESNLFLVPWSAFLQHKPSQCSSIQLLSHCMAVVIVTGRVSASQLFSDKHIRKK